MKRVFEIPAINISEFSDENIVTSSSTGTNADAMETSMQSAGFNTTSVSVLGFAF